jgi:hypothetical protein
MLRTPAVFIVLALLVLAKADATSRPDGKAVAIKHAKLLLQLHRLHLECTSWLSEAEGLHGLPCLLSRAGLGRQKGGRIDQ